MTAQPDWRTTLRSSRGGTLAVLILTAVIVLAGVWFTSRSSGETASAPGSAQAVQVKDSNAPAPKAGEAAPDFEAMTTTGQKVSLSQLKGKPVWITFGASWCASCRVEMPDIQEAWDAAKGNGTTVLGIYMQEDSRAAQQYADRLSLGYTHIPDADMRLGSLYRVMGLPTHYFVDRSGTLRSVQVGVLTREKMDSLLKEIDR